MLKTASAVLAFSMALAGFAYADEKDKYHGGAMDARDHGYQHGYRDGFHKGVDDLDHHRSFKAEVKDDDAGYQGYMGSKDQYKSGFREGFTAGYDDAFHNRPARFSEIYGPYDERYRSRGTADRYDDIYAQRGWAASDVAFDVGYRDGLAAGSDDYRDHRDSRPEDRRDFKDADHGYRSSYGDKTVYQQRYRDGFEEGYRDGYRGTTR